MTDDKRGFAKMKEEGRDEEISDIASQGGRAAHDKGTAHEFTSEEAREAGRKGGQASGQSRSNEEQDENQGGVSGMIDDLLGEK